MGRNRSLLRRVVSLVIMITIIITSVPTSVYAQEQEYLTYQIKDGDTIKKVADRFNTSVEGILKLNNIKNLNVLYTGKEIKVPLVAITYVVKKGDTLTKIAKDNGTTIDTIAKSNKIANVNLIRIGQKLTMTKGYKEENPGSTKIKEVVVSTQEDLLKALASKDIGVIWIKTSKEVTFEIPKKNYKTKRLIVDAKNADVVNQGTFHQIVIQAIKATTFYEYGNKNIIIVKADAAHLVIGKTAVIGKVILEQTNQDLLVDNLTKKSISIHTSSTTLKVKAENVVDIKKGIVKHEDSIPGVKPTERVTPTATPKPTIVPSVAPTATPTVTPDIRPTDIPVVKPTITPTPVKQVPSDVVDFSAWKLQLPIAGETGLSVKEVFAEKLNNGFVHDEYFYVDTDGGIVFDCPVTGFKTANTNYARTELRELMDGKNSAVNWGWSGTHILRTSESVTKVPSTGKTVVSQIHGIYPNGDNGPVLVKVQYEYALKAVVVMLKTGTAANSAEQRGYFYGVDLGQRFDTEIKCVEGVLYVTITSGDRTETYTHNFLEKDPTWGGQLGYFKVGNYIQDSDVNYENEGATVKVYSIETFHDDNYVEQVPIQGLSIKQESVTLGIGETIGLEPVYAPVDTTNKAVIYSVVSGQTIASVNKQGTVTAMKEGEAIVRATSKEDGSVYAECTILVTLESHKEAVVLYEQNFGINLPYDIANAEEWCLGSTGTGNVSVVNEDTNYVLKLTDQDIAGTAKTLVYFPSQTDTTTISYRIRVDEDLVKDPDGAKAQTSYLYLPVGGQEGFMNSADEMFRLRNGATYQGGFLIDHHWQFSHGYLDATMNYTATEFTIGEWKEITLVITPDNGTANANMTDVYVDGFKVASKINNNKVNSYVNQAEFYTGTKDQISFSIDDLKIYAGVKVTEAEGMQEPTSITLGTTPSTIAVGDSFQLTPLLLPAEAKQAVSYLIAEGSECVSVSKDGLLTAIKSGNATIRVYSTGNETIFAEITVTIVEESTMVRVESIELLETVITLNEGEVTSLVPILLPNNATEKRVSYEVIRGFDVVSITSEGVLSTAKTGLAAVRITCMDNPSLFVDCDISVVKKVSTGSVIVQDSFDAPLDLSKWTLATSNINNTVTEVVDGMLHLVDNNVSGQPRAYLSFEPQASTVTIEFNIKVAADTIYNTNKVSALCVAFGTGSITATANETFRFKTSAEVLNDSVVNRRFVYNKEEGQSGFYDLSQGYELDQWYHVKLVTTPNDGSAKANTTDIYINDVLLIEGAANKTKAAIIDKIIFQAGTADLMEYFIDDLVITAGEPTEQDPVDNQGYQLVYEESFEQGTLPVATSTTNPSERPSWKISTATDCISEVALTEQEQHALQLFDFNAGSQPKAQLIFNPISNQATVEFRLKMASDEIYSDGSNQKASAFCVVFGSTTDGTITTKANEMFRFKTIASVDSETGLVITSRNFQYENADAQSFVTLTTPSYELDTYYLVKFVITLGEQGKVKMYIDGVEIAEGSLKKNNNQVDTILFQSGSKDLTKYWIDDVKIYQGLKED